MGRTGPDGQNIPGHRDVLILFHKINCGAVSIEKDKYMTPAHSLKTTRSSHNAQYRRHQTNSGALKNFPPPPATYSKLE